MPRRRKRLPRDLIGVISAILAAAAVYVLGMAWLQSRGQTYLSPADLVLPRLVDVVVAGWLFWIGSSIGSFLNVVAWRMPRGESVGGRSHCPRCLCRLKARDNLPVLGWIALRGRCRTCRLPISPRYPIVEAAVGLSVTLVGVAELYQWSLPGQRPGWHGATGWAPSFDTQTPVILGYHVLALAVSWAFGLIRLDGHRLPGRLQSVAGCLLVLPMLAYPPLMVIPWHVAVPVSWDLSGHYVDALLRVATAVAVAVVLARYLARGICPGADPKLDPLSGSVAKLIDLILVLAVPAITVGWQAMPALIVVASLVAAWSRRVLPAGSDALGRLAIAMPVAMTFQLAGWRWLHHSGWWPSAGTAPAVMLAWLAVVLAVPLWLRDPRGHSEGRGRS